MGWWGIVCVVCAGVVFDWDPSAAQQEGSICGEGEFECELTEQCVSGDKVCDGNIDCADFTDELNCTLPGPVTVPGSIRCWGCVNRLNGVNYDHCSLTNHVIHPPAYLGYNCTGKCFTRRYGDNNELLARGCTTTQWAMPQPLPPDGCYTWRGSEVWCVCSQSGCNGPRIGEAGNDTFDAHLPGVPGARCEQERDDTVLPCDLQSGQNIEGLVLCYTCLSVSSDGASSSDICPRYDSVNPGRAYLGNCTGSCITNTFMDQYGREALFRGCSTDKYGLPDPLPEDGCYKWYSELWCVCRTDGCNGLPMREAGNDTFDAHLPGVPGARCEQERDDTVLPCDLQSGQNIEGLVLCYNCLSVSSDGASSSDICPRYDSVNPGKAYLGNCTGSCITNTFMDKYGREALFRGCSTDKYGLPDPLPEDGCYKWYSELWCVCRTDGCNGLPMSPPVPGVEFDGFTGDRRNQGERTCRKCWPLLLVASLLATALVMAESRHFSFSP